ncbi:protein HEADING DATE REPRESSOR 1-like [Bidens hawaiensis]|uniref:protein HEADING DATE REPRESSOR 1-like n=1 Tax=Bidens hawaiensis TaxID=980011 RepID=UPI00404AACFF
MEEDNNNNNNNNNKVVVVNGFSPVSSTPVFWKSRKRSGSTKNLHKDVDVKDAKDAKDEADKTTKGETLADDVMEEPPVVLSEKRKALFEPLEPIMDLNGRRPSAESLLPPPDFDSASYPRGWLIGKKRKLVNVDVVESMRRIAVQEMNRKDREIDGLNEQLEEDSRVLEHLQLQLLDERSKRADVERQNAMLQNQVDMLMNMLQEPENIEDEEEH